MSQRPSLMLPLANFMPALPGLSGLDGSLKGFVSDRAIEVGRVKRHYR